MTDELIDHLQRLHFHRIGFVMTYHRGGLGSKLLTSSYLYYQRLLLVLVDSHRRDGFTLPTELPAARCARAGETFRARRGPLSFVAPTPAICQAESRQSKRSTNVPIGGRPKSW